jgi:hypothetical protein
MWTRGSRIFGRQLPDWLATALIIGFMVLIGVVISLVR